MCRGFRHQMCCLRGTEGDGRCRCVERVGAKERRLVACWGGALRDLLYRELAKLALMLRRCHGQQRPRQSRHRSDGWLEGVLLG